VISVSKFSSKRFIHRPRTCLATEVNLLMRHVHVFYVGSPGDIIMLQTCTLRSYSPIYILFKFVIS